MKMNFFTLMSRVVHEDHLQEEMSLNGETKMEMTKSKQVKRIKECRFELYWDLEAKVRDSRLAWDMIEVGLPDDLQGTIHHLSIHQASIEHKKSFRWKEIRSLPREAQTTSYTL